MIKDLKPYLPSKKFVIGISIAAVIVVLILILQKPDAEEKFAEKYSDVTIGNVIDKDSDGDGVPDWQERLYGLRLDIPDSDNDGISDRTEVMQLEGIASQNTVYNSTDALSRDMYIIVTALAQGEELNPKIQANLSQMLVNYISAEDTLPTMTEDDLVIVYDSVKTTGAYSQQHTQAMSYLRNIADPTLIVEEAVRTNNPELLDGITDIQNAYQNALNELDGVAVPSEIAPYHLVIVNSLEHIVTNLGKMTQYFEDPLLTFSGIVLYNEHIEDYISITQALYNDILEPLAQDLSYYD